MANSDYNIANQSFPSFRTDLNNALAAIASTNSGTSAPSTTFANQLWYDTSANILYIRSEANDANLALFSLDQSSNVASTLATTIDVADASGTNTAGTALNIQGGAGTGSGAAGKIFLKTAPAGSSGSSVNSHATQMTIGGSGVGIGVETPSAQLHIQGDDTSNQVIIENTSDTADGAPDLLLKRNSASPADNDEVGQILFQGRNDNSQFPSLAHIRVTYLDVTDTTEDAAMQFRLMTGGSNQEVMRLQDGFVGIGTTSPARMLHVHESGSNENAYIHLTNAATGATTTDGFSILSSGTASGRITINQRENQSMLFSTNNTERLRLEATGEFNVGTTGTSGMVSILSTGSSKPAIFSNATNASYSGVEHRIRATRAGSSSYFFIFAESDSGSDTEFFVRGNGNVKADGSFTGGGADYAEMFEWEDGNSDNEDRRGYSVVLTSGNKVRKATSDDKQTDIIGIVSGNAMIVGDTQSMKWENKYLKDDFGNYIFESYTVTSWTDGETEHSYDTDKIPSDLSVPKDAVVSDKDDSGAELKRRKLNSDYDDTKTYIPREERQEWDAIGMVGKLRMRSGQPTGDRWIKMRDVASGVEEWLVR